MFSLKEECTNVVEGTYLGEMVKNPSVNLSLTLTKNEKVEHYKRINIHKLIALKFWIKNGVNV